MTELEQLLLHAVQEMEKMNAGQIRRFLFEADLWPECDLAWPLANLRQEGLLEQALSATGIQYMVTPRGRQALLDSPLDALKQADLKAKAEEYRELFGLEQDYLAQYSEQATGVVPVFLSIRQKEKILFKVNVIVHDVQTAEIIKRNWMKNAQKAYEAVWECIGEGEPFPTFE